MVTRRHNCRDSQSHELLSLHHREPGRLSTSHRPVPTLLSRPVQGPSEPSGEETDLFQPEGSSLTPQRLPASYPTQLSNRGDTTSHCYFTVSPAFGTPAISFPCLCALPCLADLCPFPLNCKLLDGTPVVCLTQHPPVPTVLPSTQ